jgi:hypothetical protein
VLFRSESLIATVEYTAPTGGCASHEVFPPINFLELLRHRELVSCIEQYFGKALDAQTNGIQLDGESGFAPMNTGFFVRVPFEINVGYESDEYDGGPGAMTFA